MITDSLRGSAFNTLTAKDQISHATWTGNRHIPMRDKDLSRRQIGLNAVRESETHQLG